MIATIIEWMEDHGVTVGLFLAGAGAAYKLGTRHTDRKDRAADRDAAARTAQQHAQDEIDAADPSFAAWLSVPYGAGTGLPAQAPVVVEVHKEGVWVHGARLSWRYNSDADVTWRLHDAPCDAFREGDSLPMARGHAETVGLSWPGGPLPEQKAITWALDIEWGLSRVGQTRVYEHPSGSTSWQQVT